MNDWPCVTAVVNTYERPTLLSRALKSILEQDFTDFEVVVVHDGPAAPETVKVCREYGKLFDARDVQFNFFSLDENSGYQCVPKNVAIWHARGDYISFLDDDNEWTPTHLSVLHEAIEEGEQWPDFVYGRREYIDERADKSTKLFTGPSPFVPMTKKAAERLADSPTNNFIDTSDVLIAKGALWRMQLATGMMWNESKRRFGDWELFARGVFFSGWRGKAVDEIVQRYYWHGGNLQLTRPVQETPKQKVLNESPGIHSNAG